MRGFTVMNHVLLPGAYRSSTKEDCRYTHEAAQVWNVSCLRQARIEGRSQSRSCR